MSVPQAVAVFVARACKVVPGFEPDAAGLELVTEICERLDRLPLAIELAAARLTLMPLPTLAEHMATEALSLSGPAQRAGTSRGRTLRETIQWSVDLLATPEALALSKLAVFDGGFTIDAAQAVLGADVATTLQALDDLVGSSLLVGPAAEETLTRRAPRFRLLNTIRDFALGQLTDGDVNAVRRQISSYLAGLFPDPDQSCLVLEPVVEVLEADVANLRLALTWLSEDQPGTAAHLMVATSRALITMGESNLVAEFTALLYQDDRVPAVPRAQLGALLGVCLSQADRDAEALELHRSALAVLGAADDHSYPRVVATTYFISGLADMGHYEEVAEACDAAIELGRATGQPRWLSLVLDGVSYAARVSGDSQRSLRPPHWRRGGALHRRRRGRDHGPGVPGACPDVGRPAQDALAEAQLAVEAGRGSRTQRYLYYAISARARVLQAMGRDAEAAADFVDALAGCARARVLAADLGWAAAALSMAIPPMPRTFSGRPPLRQPPKRCHRPAIATAPSTCCA